ncbi:hypothetical protein [Flectobacillus major]|jgi:arginine-tRNA-protein transferase|uniref:hypothetical protein n=1 Tax=Flectobacillus major TaxID=103 RepID=UPI0003F80FC8|nr:hypothetical protein [Flectobacillus major]
MLAELHSPEHLPNKELDTYLADGWFRMGQSIFTTNFLKFNSVFYSAIWLRIDLFNLVYPKTKQKLAKLNAKFRVEIQPASLTMKQEALFAKYRQHITFDTSSSLQQLLYGDTQREIFDAYEVNVYDNQKLIATGFFDLGEDSAAGISCFYDPEYKKHSLGKYLMYLKMDFCQSKGMNYFYPGYFVPGYPLFDYKADLAPQSLEYLDVFSELWKPFSTFLPENTPIKLMQNKLLALQDLLEEEGVPVEFMHYEYFDANLVASLNGLSLLDAPLFLFCLEKEANFINPIITFDIQKQAYRLVLCTSVFQMDYKGTEKGYFGEHLLQPSKYLFTTESVDIMAHIIAHSLKKTVQ